MSLSINEWMGVHFDKNIQRVAVAVSGGADSLCLAHLLKQWCDKNGVQLYAYTVNHGLRKEAGQEAKGVHHLLTQWGILHKTLLWRGKKPTTHIEEQARLARYHLLYQACQKERIQHLFLAHHIEDQAETFWMRFVHGSSLDGLTAMESVSHVGDIFLMRPLLANTKVEITSYLKKHKIQWFEDTMNHDDTFERVRWRKNQSLLSQMGLTPQVIYRLTERFKYTRQTMDFYGQSFIQSHVFISPMGYAFIQDVAWQMVPMAIQLRVLQHIIPFISGEDKILSLEGLENLLNDKRKSITFGGCLFIKNAHGIYIAKEHRTPLKSMLTSPQKWVHWDRFDILSHQKVKVCLQENQKSYKNIPTPVQKAFPYIKGDIHYSIDSHGFCGMYIPGMPVLTQKELEKKAFLDYKKGKKTIYIHFNPRKK